MTTLHCDFCAFLHVSQPWLAKYLPEWITFETKDVEKNENMFYVQYIFFQKFLSSVMIEQIGLYVYVSRFLY
jgi:hypothetical protein